MKSFALLATTLAIALGSGPVLAKGGQDSFERQEKLKAAFKEARKDREANPGPSLFERLFGAEEKQGATEKTDRNTGKLLN